MSVQTNTYVLAGVKLPFNFFTEEQRESGLLTPYMDSAFNGIEHHNGICVLDDGCSGDYTFVGRVLAKSIDEDGTGIPATDCVIDGAEFWMEVGGQIEALCGAGARQHKLSIWAFTHTR